MSERTRLQFGMVGLYLFAVVLANMLVAWLGPSISILDAFLFIGLNLTSRDVLHDFWGARYRFRMAMLITAGSALSWLTSVRVAHIAAASFMAFGASEAVDTLVYQRLLRRPWLLRVNGSNLASAAVDSLVFPTLAFGGFLPWIVVGQFAAKTVGGSLWALLLSRYRRAVMAFAVLFLLPVVPARAQIVTLDVGAIQTANFRRPVFESFLASPPFLHGRAFMILSWTPEDARPAVLPRIGADVLKIGRVTAQASTGFNFLPFNRYSSPHWAISGQLLAAVARNWGVLVIYTQAPTRADDWSVVVKLSRTVWFRR